MLLNKSGADIERAEPRARRAGGRRCSLLCAAVTADSVGCSNLGVLRVYGVC